MITPPLPRAAHPFVTFGTLLRANGFAVAPEQTMAFLESVELLGPRSMMDIRRAAHATLSPPAERYAAFDALFNAHFLGASLPMLEPADADEDTLPVQEADDDGFQPPLADEINETGQAATAAEALSVRQLLPQDEAGLLQRFMREVAGALPQRRGYRHRAANAGTTIDVRQLLKIAVKNDGEIIELPELRRKLRQRNVLLLIDVSGSMKARSDANLRFAHALTQAGQRIEVFTFGTRLTRITRALKLKNRDQALTAAADTVSDRDGGTRIGEALRAFLSVPRFAGYARGALVVIVSDGLERGDHTAMTDAVARLGARAWRLEWLTPFAADPGFKPETAALKSILPFLDHLGDASSTEGLIAELLSKARERAA